MGAAANLFVRIGADITEFQKKMSEAGNVMQKTGQSMASIGDAWTKSISLPLAGLGLAAGAAANAMDEAYDKIRVGTGAVGESLESLKDSFTNVFTSVPASTGDAATAIADLNTRLGLSGPALEEMATQMLNLARIAEKDVGTVISTATRVFGDWQIATDDQSGALDYLFKASQATGIEIDSLSQKMVQYGAPLRGMGVAFEDAAALVAKFEKEGVNTELVLGSLRIALTRMAEEGVTDASEGLRLIIEDIEAAGSAGEANALALEAFGSRAGPDMAAAIREGRFEIDELVASLRDSNETINQASSDTLSFGERMTMLKNKMMDAIEPLGDTLLKSFEKMRPTIEKVIEIIGKMMEGFTNLPEPVQNAVLVIGGAFVVGGPILSAVGRGVTAFGKLAPAFGSAASKIGSMIGAAGPWGLVIAGIVAGVTLIITNWETISKFFEDLWKGITEVAKIAWDGIKSFFSGVWDGIKAAASAAWEGIKFVLTASWDNIIEGGKVLWDGMKGFFSGLWDGIKNTAKAAWDGIKGMLKTAWEGIKGVAETVWGGITGFFGGIWDAITGKSKDAAQEATAAMEEMSDELVGNSIIPDMVLGVDNWMEKLRSVMSSKAHLAINGTLEEFSPMLRLPDWQTPAFALDTGSGLGSRNVSVYAPVSGNYIKDDYDIEKIGDLLVKRLQRAGVA